MTVVLSRDESSTILLILILGDLVTSQWVSNGLELSHLIKRRSSFWYYVIYIFFRRMTKKKYDFTCEELHKRAKTASSRRSKVLSCTAWLWRDIWGIFSTHYWYMKSIMAKDISKKCLSQNNWRSNFFTQFFNQLIEAVWFIVFCHFMIRDWQNKVWLQLILQTWSEQHEIYKKQIVGF